MDYYLKAESERKLADQIQLVDRALRKTNPMYEDLTKKHMQVLLMSASWHIM